MSDTNMEVTAQVESTTQDVESTTPQVEEIENVEETKEQVCIR